MRTQNGWPCEPQADLEVQGTYVTPTITAVLRPPKSPKSSKYVISGLILVVRSTPLNLQGEVRVRGAGGLLRLGGDFGGFLGLGSCLRGHASSCRFVDMKYGLFILLFLVSVFKVQEM